MINNVRYKKTLNNKYYNQLQYMFVIQFQENKINKSVLNEEQIQSTDAWPDDLTMSPCFLLYYSTNFIL